MNKLTFGLWVVLGVNAVQGRAIEIERVGSPEDKVTQIQFATCLAGGALDEKVWDQGWVYFINRAGHGDALVIHANRPSEGYAASIYHDQNGAGFEPLNSVTEVVLEKKEDVADPRFIRLMREAEVVFFAGGDQSYYVDWFKNSTAMEILQAKLDHWNVIVAGTSAGMAFLGGIDFAAHFDSPHLSGGMVTAADVLENPAATYVDLDPHVLIPPLLSNVVTDSHFHQRKREGRLVGFMAKAAALGLNGTTPTTIRGIGADENVLVCYDRSGIAEVFGEGDAYFLRGNAAIESFAAGKPLRWEGANHDAIFATIISSSERGATFDLRKWVGKGGTTEYWWVTLKNGKSVLKRRDGKGESEFDLFE